MLKELSWYKKKTHIFVLSNAGKPIFSMHPASEEFLSSFMGLVQAIISYGNQYDGVLGTITSIAVQDLSFVFRIRSPINMLAIAQGGEQVKLLSALLDHLYSQIVFILTSHGISVLKKKMSYDLRELLGGTDHVMQSLIETSSCSPNLQLGFRIAKLEETVRNNLSSILLATHSQEVLYSILLYRNSVVTLVQPGSRERCLIVEDIILISNFVAKSSSFRAVESFTPICLPNFNAGGFLYAYIADLSADMHLVLISPVNSAKHFHKCQKIKLEVSHQLQERNHSHIVDNFQSSATDFESANLWHYVVSLRNHSQYSFPPFMGNKIVSPNMLLQIIKRYNELLFRLNLCGCTKNGSLDCQCKKVRENFPLVRSVLENRDSELVVAVAEKDLIVIAAFDPFTATSAAIKGCHALLQSTRKGSLFLLTIPSFLTPN